MIDSKNLNLFGYEDLKKVDALCPVFNVCGGCLFQNISYDDELKIKNAFVKDLFKDLIDVEKVSNIICSPNEYYYRNRIDLKLLRIKSGDVFIGFSPLDRKKGIVEVEQCFIADKLISAEIPVIKKEATTKISEKKNRLANLVIRTSDSKNVFWGGIGKKSCQLKEQDYFYFQYEKKQIFYSLDTFFQANLSILSLLFEEIKKFNILDANTIFYDLYGGVGLFSLAFSDLVDKVIHIEESNASVILAKYNKEFNGISNLEIFESRVENIFWDLIHKYDNADMKQVVMIDPPRCGLSDQAKELLCKYDKFNYLIYLSCNPVTLARDLEYFKHKEWNINKVIPFDFFPKTKHVETLVLLSKY